MFKVFAHNVKTLTIIEFVADTALCYVAIVLAANQSLVSFDDGAILNASQVTMLAGQFAMVMALMYSFVGLYRRTAVMIGLAGRIRRAFLAVLVGTIVAFCVLSTSGMGRHSLGLLGRAIAYVALGAVVVRGASALAQRRATGARRILIVGTGPEAHAVARDLESPNLGTIIGFYPTESGQVQEALASRVLSRDRSIEQVVRDLRVDDVVVALKEHRGGSVPMDQLLACRIRGVRVMDLAGFYELVHSEVPTESLKASYLVYGNGFAQTLVRRVVKRSFDIVCATALLILACPVMLCAMVAIRLETEGPIIYRQERVGKGGGCFMCLKFRSMRSDAEKDGVARWASRNDSRITRVGAFMRKTRLDELPQLVSVLRGEMSMVGPRPERPGFVEALREQIPFYDIRHSVKPGVTGWAQVRYGYCASIEDSRRKHQFDLYYVKNNSLFLDLVVLMETVSVVVFREGSQ